MNITLLKTLEAFDAVKQNWCEVHARDPYATLFTRWDWLRSWLEGRPGQWVILAARPHKKSEFVAFFPLEVHRAGTRLPRVTTRNFAMAGTPDSHLSAVLCLPPYEQEVLDALVKTLTRLSWRSMALRNLHDPRLVKLLQRLGTHGCEVVLRDDRGCSSMALPDDIDAYVERTFPGKRGRELRRYARKAESVGIVEEIATPATLERNLDALLHFVSERWGRDAFGSDHEKERCRALLRAAHRQNLLHVHALWQGPRPVAVTVAFLDREAGVYYAYLNGLDRDFAAVSPGVLLIVDEIRWAVEQGFQTFDWGHGSQPYKRDLGAGEPAIYPRASLVKLRWYERLFRQGSKLPSDEAASPTFQTGRGFPIQ